eukprot:8747039-Pyramimonas_sp.AAC.1
MLVFSFPPPAPAVPIHVGTVGAGGPRAGARSGARQPGGRERVASPRPMGGGLQRRRAHRAGASRADPHPQVNPPPGQWVEDTSAAPCLLAPAGWALIRW